MAKSFINFDANASHGVLPEVEEALLSKGLRYLNPSSVHQGGQYARALIEEARESVTRLLGLRGKQRVVFLSGATEANNLVITQALNLCSKPAPNNVVALAVEHPSVLIPLERLRTLGYGSVLIPPDENLSESFLSQCSPETGLVAVMLANNESGEIFSVSEVATAVKERYPHILVHCDGVQALGRTSFSFPELGVDTLTISGHKIGALSGVGALVIEEDTLIKPLLLGGPQEKHLRAGTENVLGIVSLGIACEVLYSSLSRRIEAMHSMRKSLLKMLTSAIPDLVVLKSKEHLPNTLSLRVPGVLADDLVVALDLEGVGISSGSACASGKPEPSHVLLAMGYTVDEAKQSFRISLPSSMSFSEVEEGGAAVIRCIKRMRAHD